MDGEADQAGTAAFLTALAIRGESAEVLAAAARAVRARARRVAAPGPLVDTCGTGGDGLATFNISTAAAFVAAAAGLKVAKHGNRAASGSVGAADVLEAAGARIEIEPEVAARALDEVGICFLFAPLYHPAFRHVAPVRKALGFPTLFNLLGPLCNPAGVRRQVVGLAARDRLDAVAGALAELGCEHALVVHGAHGADEILPGGPAVAVEVRGECLERIAIDPAGLGSAPYSLEALRGGDAAANARILAEVLAGKDAPKVETVALNAGAALYVGGAAETLAGGVSRAREILASGRAKKKLDEFVAFTREVVR